MLHNPIGDTGAIRLAEALTVNAVLATVECGALQQALARGGR